MTQWQQFSSTKRWRGAQAYGHHAERLILGSPEASVISLSV